MGKALMLSGEEADAIILNVQLTGQYVKSDPQVIIQLKVEPDKEKNFIADAREILSFHDFSLVQPGAKVRVKYNPYNHKEISVIKKDSALIMLQTVHLVTATNC